MKWTRPQRRKDELAMYADVSTVFGTYRKTHNDGVFDACTPGDGSRTRHRGTAERP
jgi:hypothetical protein